METRNADGLNPYSNGMKIECVNAQTAQVDTTS